MHLRGLPLAAKPVPHQLALLRCGTCQSVETVSPSGHQYLLYVLEVVFLGERRVALVVAEHFVQSLDKAVSHITPPGILSGFYSTAASHPVPAATRNLLNVFEVVLLGERSISFVIAKSLLNVSDELHFVSPSDCQSVTSWTSASWELLNVFEVVLLGYRGKSLIVSEYSFNHVHKLHGVLLCWTCCDSHHIFIICSFFANANFFWNL